MAGRARPSAPLRRGRLPHDALGQRPGGRPQSGRPRPLLLRHRALPEARREPPDPARRRPAGPANSRAASSQSAACPHDIDYYCTTGIWQTVWLEPAPAVRIGEIRITPCARKGQVEIMVFLHAPSALRRMEVEVFDGGERGRERRRGDDRRHLSGLSARPRREALVAGRAAPLRPAPAALRGRGAVGRSDILRRPARRGAARGARAT